ncbi:MAG: right-handed parallel beta-helix repeat-containing protein [Bacteroidales bacterium]|nr:right-handed parallel beta-helix repeat-containing protein [Bacteroidales bacterium]
MNLKNLLIILCIVLFNSFFLTAQPSGGPYGPVDQTWEIPADVLKIYYAAVDGDAGSEGLSIDKPTTIEAAVKKANTAEAIILRGGIYRTGMLVFNQGIIMQPYKNEKPVLKGTYVAKNWDKETDGLWVTSWEYLFPNVPESWWRRDREEKYTPMHRFNGDMVFIDGRMLQSAGSKEELDENTFFIDYDNKKIYIRINPIDKQVEITAFNKAIYRVTRECNGKQPDHRGPQIRGLEFTQYVDTAVHIDGFYPQGISPEAEHGKDVIGTTLEHCKISYCSRIGFFLIGDSLTVRHCDVSNTSTEGVYIVASSDVLLEKNIFSKNNIENITGFFPAAVKIFNQSYRVTCRDNLVTDLPNSNGIWYDVGNVDGVFVNNFVENVGKGKEEGKRYYNFQSGFFFEISKGVICAGNVFVNCDIGSRILNSSNARVYQNTYVNSAVSFMRTERSAVGDHFDWHPATGPGVDERYGHVFENNLIYKDDLFYFPVHIFQTDSVCKMLKNPQMKEFDYNVYVRNLDADTTALILWRPADNPLCELLLHSPAELNNFYPEFEANSKLFNNYKKPLFENPPKKNYSLIPAFSEILTGKELPANINILLGNKQGSNAYVGAYPFK